MIDKIDEISEFVADITTNILIKVSKTGQILFFNSKAVCVFGKIRRGESGLEEILPLKNLLLLKHNIDVALYQQHPHYFYWEFQNRFYLVYLYPQNSSVWLCFDDITEKRQQAHLLHINNQRMKFFERISKLGYWELDISKKQFYWSDEMYTLFGIKDRGKTVYRNLIREMMHPADLPFYKQKLKELIVNHKDTEGQLRIILKNGQTRYCRFMAGIIYENGEAKAAGIFQDITYLVSMMQNFEKAKNKAEEDNMAKSYFLAQISHDIRQFLQSINLHAESLKHASKEKQDEAIKRIKELSQNSAFMLDNLLDITKAEMSKDTVNKRQFNLKDLLSKVCYDFELRAKFQNIDFKWRSDDAIIYQDSHLLERIIRNLLSNAFKYTKNKIRVGTCKNELWIVDDGCGIDSEKQKHIFEMFYQCNVNDRKKGGVGLGLYIVSQLADLLGISVKIKSRKSKYTIVRVCF